MKDRPRIVWITGASSGIGRALAEVFAENGDVVVATSRKLSALKVLQTQLLKKGSRCEILRCDVRKEEDVKQVAKTILKNYKTIDILLNNAGITSFNDFHTTSTREFDDILATNLRSLFLTSKAVLPKMLDNEKGTILNILSYAAKATYTKSAAYSTAKAGAEALMNVLREEVRDRGIKVVNVYPGAVLTAMWPKKLQKRYSRSMMSPLDVAKLVYGLSVQPDQLHVEELIVRPPSGDLRV
ncbi:MAG: SDR family oxidoreductase [Ignavibacteriae bacterium]|nr:SDR family oxidoreductase [Ignavibacteriota bacterium]